MTPPIAPKMKPRRTRSGDIGLGLEAEASPADPDLVAGVQRRFGDARAVQIGAVGRAEILDAISSGLCRNLRVSPRAGRVPVKRDRIRGFAPDHCGPGEREDVSHV